MGQCEQVLQYIKDFGSINPAQAFLDLGCYRAKNRYGKAVSYAEYRLEDNNAQ